MEERLMTRPLYPTTSWFDPRLEKGTSPIHGAGIFTTAAIQAGERLLIPGGIVFTLEEWGAGSVPLDPAKVYNESRIDEHYFLANPIDEDLLYFFNHSCDPNLWGDVARRDIVAGEELTTDYGLEMADENYLLEPCRCGTALCRGRVTGNDWNLPELQQRYRGHFPPFIERKIEQFLAEA
jgi:hypothetical protein